jgi:hypothetical protein
MFNIKKINLLTPEIYMSIHEILKKGVKRLRDGETIASIVNDINTQSKYLWIVYEDDRPLVVVITSFVQYPHVKRVLFYLVAGDKIDETLYLHDEIIKDAVYHKCSEIEIFGRRGWIKKLKSLGYKLEYVAMSAKIDRDILWAEKESQSKGQ